MWPCSFGVLHAWLAWCMPTMVAYANSCNCSGHRWHWGPNWGCTATHPHSSALVSWFHTTFAGHLSIGHNWTWAPWSWADLGRCSSWTHAVERCTGLGLEPPVGWWCRNWTCTCGVCLPAGGWCHCAMLSVSCWFSRWVLWTPRTRLTVYAVTSLAQLAQRRTSNMSKIEREALLCRQGPIWGDDEILNGLQCMAQGADQDQHVLLITGLALADDTATWAQLCASLGSVGTVLTAVMVDHHWYPLVWRLDPAVPNLFTRGVIFSCVCFWDTGCSRGTQRGVNGVWNNKLFSFVVSGHCGALVWLFAKHLLWGLDFPTTLSQLEAQACQLRKEFAASLGDQCIRPRLAALGLSLADRLAEVLVERGVGSSESLQGAKDVIHHLGKDHVGHEHLERAQMACQSTATSIAFDSSFRVSESKVIEKRGGTFQVGNEMDFCKTKVWSTQSLAECTPSCPCGAQFRGPPELFPWLLECNLAWSAESHAWGVGQVAC